MGGQITYARHKCFYCGKDISSNGLAKTSHYRTHVRNNECIEIKSKKTNRSFYYMYVKSFDGMDAQYQELSHWQKQHPNEIVLKKYPHYEKKEGLYHGRTQ